MSDLNNVVYFFDESSVHTWTTQRFAYMNPANPFQTTIRSKGEHCTMLGSIGGHLNGDIDFHYTLDKTTNKETVMAYLVKLRA